MHITLFLCSELNGSPFAHNSLQQPTRPCVNWPVTSPTPSPVTLLPALSSSHRPPCASPDTPGVLPACHFCTGSSLGLERSPRQLRSQLFHLYVSLPHMFFPARLPLPQRLKPQPDSSSSRHARCSILLKVLYFPQHISPSLTYDTVECLF